MSNSTLISGALLFAFILFLAAKNRLATYANVLWGNTVPSSASAGSGGVVLKGATPSGSASSPATASPSSTSSLSPNAAALLKNAFTSVGNGVTTQQFSQELDDAASMSAPLGVLGF